VFESTQISEIYNVGIGIAGITVTNIPAYHNWDYIGYCANQVKLIESAQRQFSKRLTGYAPLSLFIY